MAGISVLIPTYNQPCLELVSQLQAQLEQAAVPYEIIVADDGSTDERTVEANLGIATLVHCQYIIRKENAGRAVIRNFLAQEAQYDLLLFIDSDMSLVDDQYIRRYLAADCDTVVDGGVRIVGDEDEWRGNLRYLYEKAEEPHHTAPERQRTPYQHLHTANLLIRRELMLKYPFDERFRHYGYEDVLLGKTLRRHRVAIRHIDNPLGFSTFEANADFVAKTEEGLRTLYEFREDLRGYSRLLTLVSGIHIPLVKSMIRWMHRLAGPAVRRNLCSTHPRLFLFKLYKLGYYLCQASR
ncbi:MAG: glycosyltransferase family 2 protein [Prevotella sp.]|nr:glycosyltransferase family 2 protein [Prevotella sp.]